MRILLNNQTVNIPSDFSEITLQQQVDFQEQHGKELDAKAKLLLEMPDSIERDLELTEFRFEQMFRTLSFYSGVSVESLKESEFVDRIASIYYSCLHQLHVQETDVQLEREFVWNNEIWEIAEPELKNGDRMLFGEFIDSKQIIQDMVGLGANRWECLIPLCAIFLRKRNEKYIESFSYEQSERRILMKNLPLNIAMQVGFFLTGSLSMFSQTFRSLDLQQ